MDINFKRIVKRKKGRLFEKWVFDAKNELLSGAAIEDIDKDGEKEILFGTKKGRLYCLRPDSTLKWKYDVEADLGETESFFYEEESVNSIDSTPLVEDINEDGEKEIVFSTELGVVYVLNKDGELLWTYKTEGAVRATPECINAKRGKALIFGSMDGNVYLVNNKGKLLRKFEVKESIESPVKFIKKDSEEQIIFGCESGDIVSIDIEGGLNWKYETGGKITAKPIVTKVENGEESIIVGSTDGVLYCLNFEGGLDWKYQTEGAIYSRVTVGDVNKDGEEEILFGSCDDNIYCLTVEGEKVWSFETDFWVVSPPVIADIDNDGKKEVIAGSYDHNIYVLAGEGDYVLDYLPGFSGAITQAGATEITTKEAGNLAGKKIWQFKTEGIVVGCTYNYSNNNVIVNVKSGKVDDIARK